MVQAIRRFIPGGYEPITRDGLPGVVYADELHGIAYRGRSSKPAWHYRFRSVQERDREIDRFFSEIAEYEKYKERRRQERRAFVPSVKAGVVLYASWGYDQTNVDFFIVVGVAGRKVTLQEIGSKTVRSAGFMCGYVAPVPDFRRGKPFSRLIQPGNAVRIDDVRSAFPLEEKEEVFSSWYA